jgi:hypothetical protein
MPRHFSREHCYAKLSDPKVPDLPLGMILFPNATALRDALRELGEKRFTDSLPHPQPDAYSYFLLHLSGPYGDPSTRAELVQRVRALK